MVSMHEESSPSPQPLPSPQCVGREFVRQYYTLLAEAPRYVHRFYSNESIFVHGTDTDEVVGQTAIQNKIKDMSFDECRTRIRGLDAHETLGKGVVVQVVGEISVSGGPMRRFVQTFVLAPQSEKKYYVHNDIFRYEDELFSEKIAQENGAPADPEAEATIMDDGHRRLGSIHNQATMNNGNTHHPEDIEHVRFNIPSPAQQQPIQMPIMSQPQNQPLSSQIGGSGYAGAPTTGPVGAVNSAPQISDGPPAYIPDGDVGFVSVHPASAASTVQQPVAPGVVPFGQQPLPQRTEPGQHPSGNPTSTVFSAAPMPQRTQPAQPPSAHPTTTVITPAPMPSTQSEPPSTTGPATITEQPQRPPSADKASPSPSEEREETVETGSADKTWANVAKSHNQKANTNRSPHQVPLQQQSQHASPAAGTSAPAMLSPTGAQAPPYVGQAPSEPANKFQPHQQQHPAGRHGHSHRQGRSANAQIGFVSQDARSSPAPSGGGGHQPSFPGGANRAGSASGGQSEMYPIENQVYVKNLPFDTTDDALREYFESQGYSGSLETRVKKKNANLQHNQACFAFMTFDSAETAQKLIQRKKFTFHGVEIMVDEKRNMDKSGGGGGNAGTFPYNGGTRPFPAQGGMGSGGRGNMNHPRGMMSRGPGAPNRPSVPGGPYVGQGGGGGGNRQPGGRVYSNSGGRGGGGNAAPPHPQ